MTIMTPAAPQTRATPDDLLKLEGDGLFELVDGRVIEKTMSSLSGETAVIISSSLNTFAYVQKLGKIYSETSFRCFPDNPDQLRRPDIAFIASNRLSGVPAEGPVPIRPDLAIEVVSPNDSVYDLDHKLADCESAGIPLVWVFNPDVRTVHIFRPGQPIERLGQKDHLHGEPVLPGYTVIVGDLFPEKVVTA